MNHRDWVPRGRTWPAELGEHTIMSRVSPCPESGCWLWTGRYGPRNYGQIRVSGHEWRAHRLSWVLFCGPIPGDLSVLHKCDVPSCVNPDHLYLGTEQDNADDAVARSRLITAGLTSDQAAEIRRRRAAGETLMALAAEYGVSHLTIHRIAAGKVRWAKHGKADAAWLEEAMEERP